MKIAIVAPCHVQPSQEWIDALQKEISTSPGAQPIIIDDSGGTLTMPADWQQYDYTQQQNFLAELYQQFATLFHKCSAGRVLGHLIAWHQGFDVIIGLDSDCVVPEGFIQKHIAYLNNTAGAGWENPIAGTGFFSRGFPYSKRNWTVVANMGLWSNVLDINGKDRAQGEPTGVLAENLSNNPVGVIPFSGMNFALTHDAVPAFLFIPNFISGADNFQRIDDIWGGYIFQGICRKMKASVRYGEPVVYHDTVVDAAADTAEEQAMYLWEDRFMASVDKTLALMPDMPEGSTFLQTFQSFVNYFNELSDPALLVGINPAMAWWLQALQKYA